MGASADSVLTSKKSSSTQPMGSPSPLTEAGEKAKLLALAEDVAHFGSWEWDLTKPRADWSPELFRIFGIEPRPEGLSAEEYRSCIHPDDLPEISRRMEESITRPVLNQKTEVDYRIIRPDGQTRMIHSQRLIREVTPEGKLKVIVGVDQDVTELRRSEEALRRSEARFRAVAEAANILVYEFNLVAKKIKIIRGEKELVGFESETKTHDINWALSRIHPDDVPYIVTRSNEIINNPKIDHYILEYRLLHKNGSYITVKDTAKAVIDKNGKKVLFIGGVRDITQRRRDQEEIRQYNKHLEQLVEERTRQLINYERLAAIGEVAGMIGHDIRNPLQALTGEVYLIRSDLDSVVDPTAKQEIVDCLNSVDEDITYINKIIADLQDYSRKLTPEIIEIDLAQLLGDLLKTIAIPPKIQLTVNIEPLTKLTADPTLLRRALTNLVNNAVQAMPDGGRLTISGYSDHESTFITVEDTGVGIPSEIQPKLFTPMFTTKAKGQGLGLAVVKRLVEVQGGSITFESQSGRGTKFLIKLPIHNA